MFLAAKGLLEIDMKLLRIGTMISPDSTLGACFLQKSLDEVDPKLLETFSKLGIPINEQKRLAGVKDVAYDYVFDSESIATTFKAELAQQGIIFCSISEAVREYPDLVRKYLGSVVRCAISSSTLLPSRLWPLRHH